MKSTLKNVQLKTKKEIAENKKQKSKVAHCNKVDRLPAKHLKICHLP